MHVCTYALNRRRVKHDSHARSDGLGVQIRCELGTHNAVITVSAGDLAPHRSELAAVLEVLGLVDESHSLSEVKLGTLVVLYAVQLQEGGVVVGVTSSASVAENRSLGVQASGL
jgi:hypothetical protein